MKRVLLVWVSFLLVPLGSPLWGQSTFGVIRGTIRDAADALVVGATATVTSEGTAIARQVKSDQLGNYEVGHLNPGLYTVAIEVAGFQRHVSQGINLETGQILRVDVALKVGQVLETVSVTGEAPTIETETGTVSDVRTGRQMRELPIQAIVRADANSGGIYYLMGLSPGNIRHEGTSSHTYNGTRANQSTQVMDGTQLGDQRGTQISFSQPSFETIQEMKLSSVNNSAEYSGVAAVILTSRSGTNELHGSGFYQYNSGSMNARNFYAAASPWRVLNEFGGRVGGPVRLPRYKGANRSFFFFAFEGARDHTVQLYNASVPTLAIRQGNFAGLPVVRDPTNNQPFANNTIPASRISPVSQRVQDRYYQLPNFGTPGQLQQNLRDQVTNPVAWNHVDLRIDHRFNDKNSLFGRFSRRQINQSTADGNLPNTGYMYRTRQIHNMTLVDTHIVSPSLVNEVRLGYAWHELPRWGPRKGLAEVQALGIRGLTSSADLNVAPEFQITDFTTITQIAYNTPAHLVYDLHDNVTYTTGRHSLKVGFNYRRNYDASNPIPHAVYGTYQFTGTYSGFSYGDFLLGIPQQTTRSTPRGRTYGRNQFFAGFVQDDFKVHPNLTLNLGLRYEWMNPFYEIHDQMYNFDVGTGALVVPNRQVLERDVSRLLPSSIRIVTAQEAGFPERGLRGGDRNNFGPRIGAAWRPFGNSRTVIRSAFGVFHNVLSGASFGPLVVGGPFVADELFVNRIDNGVPLFQFPEPFQSVGSLGAVNVTGVDPHLFNPYTMQWNLTVERDYAGMGLRASYIATRSVNLLYQRNFNQPVASVVPFNNNRRPFPQYRNVTIADNGASSSYHSLQFEVERKFARGLFYQFGWTWAKQLAHGRDSGELGALVEDAYNRNAEWGDDEYFMRHRVVANFVWETPFGPAEMGRGLLGHIAGGWNLSGVVLLQTGQRFTPTFTGRDPSNTQTVGGRADRIANGNLPKGQRTIDRWFDADAFVAPPLNAGRFGNSANAVLEGPGSTVFSFGLFKNVMLREKTRLEFSVNTTNTFNTPNFRNPNANISSLTQRGRITSTQGMDVAGPRTVVLGTRIEF